MKFSALLFSLICITLATPTQTVEGESKSTEEAVILPPQPPLKFQVDSQGRVSDAPGSHLILTYRDCVGQVQSSYGEIKDELLRREAEVKQKLSTLREKDESYKATKIFLMDIQERIKKYEEKRNKLFEQEILLEQVLKYLQSPTSNPHTWSFRYIVPNWSFLTHSAFVDLNLMHQKSYGAPATPETLAPYEILLVVNQHLTEELRNKLDEALNANNFHFGRLISKQTDLRKIAKIVYYLSNNLTMNTTMAAEFSLVKQTKRPNESDIGVLNRIIDEDIAEAKAKLIPSLAPMYWFAQIVIAFLDEAPRHKSVEKA
jgi:hypothetical protein